MKRIIFPGWAVPVNLYLDYSPDDILDFGFFTCEERDCATNATEVDPSELNDLFLQQAVGDEPVIVIAHSLGSLLALRSSQIFDNVKAAIIIGGFAKFTKSEPDYPDGKPESGISMMQNMMKLSPKMVLDKFYHAMSEPSGYAVLPKGKVDVARLKAGLQYLTKTDLRENLKDVNIPVLILHGDSDQIVSVKLAEFLAENIPNAKLQVIENAGHSVPFTHKKECIQLIDDFIAENNFSIN